MEVKGITIHNTENDLSARENKRLLKEGGRLNYCHFLVDEKEAIRTISEDEMALHTGKGYDLGNRYTLAIEICRSTCNDDVYLKAEERAVELIKKLMKKYHLTTDNLYFHHDFDNQRYCPHRILDRYVIKKAFIERYFKEGDNV